MSESRKPSRPKGSGAARHGGANRSGAGGGKRTGSGTGGGKRTGSGSSYGKSSSGASGTGRSAGSHRGGGRGSSGRFEAKGQSQGKGKSDDHRGGKTRSTKSEHGGARSPGSSGGTRSAGSGRGRASSERGSPTGGAARYTGGSKTRSSDAQGRSREGHRDSTGGRRGGGSDGGRRQGSSAARPAGGARREPSSSDRSRRVEPSTSHQRTRGTEPRAAGHRAPRDPLIEEIRAATPKAKQEAAIAEFEHARGLLQRGRDGAAADAAADAKRLAPRSGAVRELYGVALYRAGRYRDALGELQAYRRMTGRLDQNHLIADSYRGLGMPEKAVPVAVEAVRSRMRDEPRAEAAIVGASALADLGRFDEALGLLRGFPDRRDEADPWEIRIWYVAGDVLERAGRPSEAAEEFRKIVRYDAGAFDAAERLAALSG